MGSFASLDGVDQKRNAFKLLLFVEEGYPDDVRIPNGVFYIREDGFGWLREDKLLLIDGLGVLAYF